MYGMKMRLICKDHNELLRNCGNGNFIAPTVGGDPVPDQDGWLYFDTSEYYCHSCSGEIDQGLEPVCNWEVEVE